MVKLEKQSYNNTVVLVVVVVVGLDRIRYFKVTAPSRTAGGY